MYDMTDRRTGARDLWKPEWTQYGYCLCLTGSAARNEETAFSDIDLLVIHDNGTATHETAAGRIPEIFASGVEHVSLTVRSVTDCSRMVETDIRSWVAQMDAVFLAGNEDTFRSFRNAVREGIIREHPNIVADLASLTIARHQQYGGGIALLEPNIKNGAGTLRDIHTIYYLGLLDGIPRISLCTDPWPDVRKMLSSIPLIAERRTALLQAYEYMLAVRATMHDTSRHLHDSLDFELQRQVAATLGYGHRDEKLGVERFMHDFYHNARTVHTSLRLVFHDTMKALGLQDRSSTPVNKISFTSPEGDDEDIMRAFVDMARTGARFEDDFIRQFESRRGLRYGAKAVRMFDAIMREHAHVADTLWAMHEAGVLGAVLPEFSALEHFFQHNVYHFFTADEHTLRAIRACETSLRDSGHAASVLEGVEDISVLHYAVLLHDIAKPVDLPRHEHVGADMAVDILRRFGRTDITEIVCFLIREHLRMEQLAFRRNIREPRTIQAFVERVGTVERLQLLYLLTLADMSALNPGVLTEWKRDLLQELYENALRMMVSGVPASMYPDASREELPPASSMSGQDYSAAIQDVIDGELVRIQFQHHRAYSELTVFCLDRPQLLAQFSAALFGADCSIVDASIETRHDVVIDTFRVVDIFSGVHLQEEQVSLLKQLIRSVCAGELDPEQLFERYRRKWIRKLSRLPKAHIMTDIVYHAHVSSEGQEQTIVEVYAPDTLGLLYKLAAELSAFGLNVVFAKIATRIDGVVDSFYVVDREGRAFTDAVRQQRLRRRLLEQIQQLTR
jgi:[protein-PII] uridylyltransferase